MFSYILLFNKLLLSIGIAGSLFFSYQYHIERSKAFDEKNIIAFEETNAAAEKIEEQINYLIHEGKKLKKTLTGYNFSGTAADNDIREHLTNLLSKNKIRSEGKIFAVGVALNKGVFKSIESDPIKPDKNDLKSWYSYQKNGRINIKGKTYNYTQSNSKRTEWFTKAVEFKQPIWQEPKFSSTSGTYIIGYSIPFYKTQQNNSIAGVITLNYSITELKSIMRARKFWRTGYGFIVSEKGNLIYHPNEQIAKQEVVSSRSNNTKYATKKDDLLSCFLSGSMCNKSVFKVNTTGQDSIFEGKDSKVFSKEIPHTNWLLHVVFMKNELGYNSVLLHRIYLGVVVSLTLSIVCFIIFIAFTWHIKKHTPFNDERAFIWAVAIAISFAFMIGLGLIAKEANVNLLNENRDSFHLTDYEDIENEKNIYLSYGKKIKQIHARFVKTGVLIQSIDHKSSDKLVITGFVWQKYNKNKTHDNDNVFSDEEKGVIFPDAVDSKILYRYANRNYVDVSNGVETVGWYFNIQLTQSIDHNAYPFDSGLLSLRLQHINVANSVVLEPDLDAYPMINSTSKPGVKHNLILSGWDVISTYFSFNKSKYNTNFGINDYINRYNLAELYFNISVQRQFINPLITHVTPMIMVFLILFLLVLLATNDKHRAEKYGSYPMVVIQSSSALLFATMLWHSSLRDELGSSGISYYECYYFLAYLMIAIVALNSVILANDKKVHFVDFEDNLLPRIFYWPFLTSILFFITLFKLS